MFTVKPITARREGVAGAGSTKTGEMASRNLGAGLGDRGRAVQPDGAVGHGSGTRRGKRRRGLCLCRRTAGVRQGDPGCGPSTGLSCAVPADPVSDSAARSRNFSSLSLSLSG